MKCNRNIIRKARRRLCCGICTPRPTAPDSTGQRATVLRIPAVGRLDNYGGGSGSYGSDYGGGSGSSPFGSVKFGNPESGTVGSQIASDFPLRYPLFGFPVAFSTQVFPVSISAQQFSQNF